MSTSSAFPPRPGPFTRGCGMMKKTMKTNSVTAKNSRTEVSSLATTKRPIRKL